MKFFKYLLTFAAGAATGALVTHIVMKDKYEAMVEEEMEAAKTYARTKIKELQEKYNKDLEDQYTSSDDKRPVSSYNKYKKVKKEQTDYTKFYGNKGSLDEMASKYADDPAEEEHPEDDEAEEEDPDAVELEIEEDKITGEELAKVNLSKPYIITADEFTSECTHYDKITLTYYDIDGVLADENEESIIDDIQTLLGEGNLVFGRGSGDPDIVYIRNENIYTDFEVIRTHYSYARDVLGVPEDL